MTKFINQLYQLNIKFKDPIITNQIVTVNDIDYHVKNHLVLPSAPQKLGFLPDKFAYLKKKYPNNIADLQKLNNLLNNVRQYLSLQYGIWSLPNQTTANKFIESFKINSLLEIMAGNAYWSLAFSKKAKTIATDSLVWSKTSQTGDNLFYPVQKFTAKQAIIRYSNVDAIFCSWAPNFGQSDVELINCWRKYSPDSRLFFVGEKDGSTNSSAFWQKAKFNNSTEIKRVNATFASFDFIDEGFFEIKK